MIDVAIVGAGRIGQVHACAVGAHTRARLVVVADPCEANAKELSQAHGVDHTTAVERVLTGAGVDAVVIGSPTRFHVEHVIAAVQAGKKVMCEKPLALAVASARDCIAELGVEADKVMMGFNRRFDPTFAEIKRRVEAGEIGELQQLTIISRDPEAPPAGYVASSGGIFKDMTIHDFDMARFFLGEIVQVSALGTNFDAGIKKAGDYDQVVVTLKSATGAIATIVNSRTCAFGYDQRLEAFGSLGALSADNLTATGVRKASASQTEAKSRVLDFFLDRYTEAYELEFDAFVSAAEADLPVSPSLHDGLQALLLSEAAALSAREGRVVDLT